MGARDVGQGEAGAVAVSHVEQLGGEREPVLVAAQVAELLEREQGAPCTRARDADRPRDVGDGQPGAGVPEGRDDGQPALDGAHVVGVPLVDRRAGHRARA